MCEDEYCRYVSLRKSGKPMGSNAPHYPNKAERVLLTQMMQKSGMSEEEVRAIKSNRQKLAKASKSMSQGKGSRCRLEYEIKRAKRNAAAGLGVPVWDSMVDAHLNDRASHWNGLSIRERIIQRIYG